MIVILPFVLTAALVAQAQTAAPTFDQTVNVTRGTRLTVNNEAGEVVMRTWDRDAVRVTARHSQRAKPGIRTGEMTLTVVGGGMGAVDFDITVPSWMPVKVTGHYNYIELNGMGAEVSAENVRGDIEIKGGRGFITAKSIEGKIHISGTQGKVSVTAINEDLVIENASGELVIDSTNGNVLLNGIRATAAEVSTVNGNITYTGALSDGGRYAFVTHNGTVRLGIQPNPNATFYVRSYGGSFSQNVGLKPQGETRSGRRNTLVGGNGSAQVEIESFNGSIRIFAGGQ
jgi:DUF4097 and DUF4098 domain-containing protein YvlB